MMKNAIFFVTYVVCYVGQIYNGSAKGGNGWTIILPLPTLENPLSIHWPVL